MGTPRELLKSSPPGKYRPRGNLSLNAKGLLQKADTALSSAQLLLASGDADGACNRAYYSMFDAARAALMAFQNSDEVLTIKTHSGLISSFSIQLVKSGLIDIELGKALNKVEDLRLIADQRTNTYSFLLTRVFNWPKERFITYTLKSMRLNTHQSIVLIARMH